MRAHPPQCLKAEAKGQWRFGHIEERAPGVLLGLLERRVFLTVPLHRIGVTPQVLGGEEHQAPRRFEGRTHLVRSKLPLICHVPYFP